jgi:hypothetical protein
MNKISALLLASFIVLLAGCGTPSATDRKSPDLTVLRATYGLGTNVVDVTQALQSAIENQALHLPPQWALGLVDPAFGLKKRVVIAYFYKGKIQVASYDQSEDLILPAP